MKTLILSSILFLFGFVLLPVVPAQASPAVVSSSAQKSDFYSSLTQLLQRHVRNGQVDYKGLRQDKAKLDALVAQIASYPVKSASAAEKKAFYLNAYNTLVLAQVLEHYPLKSVMDVPGFFDSSKFTVAGEKLTLNELENEKLREPYQDARIHFALVCAAASCPPLLNTAYTPPQVERQLEAQTKAALQHPAFIRVSDKAKKVQLSEIFKWYGSDFKAAAPSYLVYINRYRQKQIPASYEVSYYTYDWSLNDATKK